MNHEPSGPPSRPPSPSPTSGPPRGSSGDTGQYPATVVAYDTPSPEVPWSPEDRDSTPRATDHRARRALRIATNTRTAIGHPGGVSPRGEKIPPEGLWAFALAIDAKVDGAIAKIDEVLAELRGSKAKRSGLFGWIFVRGEKLLDTVLLLVLATVIAFLAKHIH